MIDWHSHILPGIDDGSQNVEESISMLKMLSEQGAECVIATPHFIASEETVDSFIERRNEAYRVLRENLFEGAPKIRLGAEVAYYPGISRLQELKQLCIEGSKCLLLEMPVSKWTEYTIKELEELSRCGAVNLVLAHIDRYQSIQNPKIWDRLRDSGCIMQVNASSLISLGSRRKIIKLMKKRCVHCIGSDCHNISTRPPTIDKAYDIVKRALGDGIIRRITELEHYLIG